MSERPSRLLSYSSIMTLMNCQKKYWLRKIAKTAVDADYVQGDALSVGKTYHQVLENCLHDHHNMDLEQLLDEAMVDNETPAEWRLKLLAMVRAYIDMHLDSGLNVIFCEMEILEDNFLGYIDAVMTDPLGQWWIVDLKTAGRTDPNLKQMLPYDLQLSLYSQRYKTVAKNLGLNPDKFGGCRYRATVKPGRFKQKVSESDMDFMLRMQASITCTDIVVTASELAQFWLQADEVYQSAVSVATKLKEGMKPMPNYGNCMAYFRPCEYWSQCHNKNKFSDDTGVQYHDQETHQKARELEEIL